MGKIFDRRKKCCCWQKIQWFICKECLLKVGMDPNRKSQDHLGNESPSGKLIVLCLLGSMGNRGKVQGLYVWSRGWEEMERFGQHLTFIKDKQMRRKPYFNPWKHFLEVIYFFLLENCLLNKDQWKESKVYREKHMYNIYKHYPLAHMGCSSAYFLSSIFSCTFLSPVSPLKCGHPMELKQKS